MPIGETRINPKFSSNQFVHLAADPKRQGPIISISGPIGGQYRYQVHHDTDNAPWYDEDQLRPSDPPKAGTELEAALVNQEFISPGEFSARITAERLATPLTDTIYALHAARIQYIPFQFKPLLRFLRADQPRLLIADEVGVGKTIEAGIILREMQSRQDVDNVLIVCPKALAQKWRDEMERFDEDFPILDGGNLRYCINQCHLEGQWPRRFSKVIVPLELLRQRQYVDEARSNKPVLESLDPAPTFSLTIVDEAHHVRNPESSSHKVARFLCESSEAVLFLSATPVQLGSDNLFQLLNLLRQDLFPDFRTFEQMAAPNSSILKALRHIQYRSPADNWQGESIEAIDTAMNTDWGRRSLAKDPRLRDWRDKLAHENDLSEMSRIQLLRDLEEAHTLAPVMNRTRRRDIGRFTTREPHTIEVAFTKEQKRFYENLVDFRRQLLLEEHDPRVVNLISPLLERQATSCLPAMLPMLDQILSTGRVTSSAHSDDLAEEADHKLPKRLSERAKELRRMASALPEHDDSKLASLIKIIEDVLTSSGKKKILIFSYFLHTLGYLQDKLTERGLRVRVISGNTEEDERGQLRKRFSLPHSNPNALDILLSSEVGCEGLDYQFCDCLANYDIPWNPMRIEQRIGRIDRFGQTSDKVHIYNFITPDTVEERVFHRCFNRLGVFEDTVGDLEAILGKLSRDLTKIAYDTTLSSQQAEEQASQMVDNKLRRAEEQRRLVEDSAALFGWQSAFADEMDALEGQGRIVSPC
ncbi:MAG: DEAD/DEAH box helicase [Chloroflexi bacterium]|nr:DEAD/DEAH box helicase [Chloroflexota bacterium]